MSANQFLVHKLLDAHVAQLAAVAGVLDAAKGKLGVRPVDVVDEHHSGLHLSCDALAAGNVFGEDGAAQTEV